MIINYKLSGGDFENYKIGSELRNTLEKKGYKVGVILFNMLHTVDIEDNICNDCDKYIFTSLEKASPYIYEHISSIIERLSKKSDIIIIGDVPNDFKKYVEKEVDITSVFNKINGNKYVKTFESFKLEQPKTMSELLEKLSVVEQNILDSVKAEIINIDEFFNENVSKSDLPQLVENGEFQKLLRIKGLKKSELEHTDDYETFLLNPFKYVLIRDNNKTDLQDPDFIIIQTFNTTEQDWNSLKMYKINGEFRNFYDKLSNRTIEIEDKGTRYIYQTSNKNEWELTNQKGTDRFPRFVRKEDLLKIMNMIDK